MKGLPVGCVLTCIAVLVAIGCGGQDDATAQSGSSADAVAAKRIDESAQVRERQQAAAETGTTTTQATTNGPTGGTPSQGSSGGGVKNHPLLSAADRASFARLAGQLPGAEGVAVSLAGVGHPVSSVGSLRTGVAWSTAKVPVAMAAIRGGVGSSANLVPAITASDNAAAERLWSALGSGTTAAARVTAQIRAAGDAHTMVQAQRLRAGYTAFGQTDWALADQARFVAGMRCVAAGRQVLALMSQVVPGQRWGLGSTGHPAQFKGGWGPGVSPGAANGWMDRQMGVLQIQGKPLAVAIATTAGDHGIGTQNLTRLANWVATHVDVSAAPRAPVCR